MANQRKKLTLIAMKRSILKLFSKKDINPTAELLSKIDLSSSLLSHRPDRLKKKLSVNEEQVRK